MRAVLGDNLYQGTLNNKGPPPPVLNNYALKDRVWLLLILPPLYTTKKDNSLK